jgi:amino acid transporter
MHPMLGVAAGWSLLIAYIGTAMAICSGLTNYVNVILKDLTGLQVFPVLISAACIGVAALLAYCDVKISARLMLGLEAVSVTLISFVAISLLVRHGFHPDMSQLRLHGVTPEKLRMGLVLAIFCLVGFESATSLGSEASRPLESIPRAVTWSAILTGAFFVFCAYTEVLGFQGEAVPLDRNLAPLHFLARKAGLPSFVGVAIDLGGIVSFFSCVLACITAAARILFLMGRHGAVHSRLGEAHESWQTPHVAVLLTALAAFLPMAFLTLFGIAPFDVYGLAGSLATFGFLTAYILISIAAPIYLRSLGRLTIQATIVSVLAILAMGIALQGSLYPVPATPYSLLPYIYAALLASGFLWSILLNARSPLTSDRIHDDSNALAD